LTSRNSFDDVERSIYGVSRRGHNFEDMERSPRANAVPILVEQLAECRNARGAASSDFDGKAAKFVSRSVASRESRLLAKLALRFCMLGRSNQVATDQVLGIHPDSKRPNAMPLTRGTRESTITPSARGTRERALVPSGAAAG